LIDDDMRLWQTLLWEDFRWHNDRRGKGRAKSSRKLAEVVYQQHYIKLSLARQVCFLTSHLAPFDGSALKRATRPPFVREGVRDENTGKGAREAEQNGPTHAQGTRRLYAHLALYDVGWDWDYAYA
jgi:hypothetical protein